MVSVNIESILKKLEDHEKRIKNLEDSNGSSANEELSEGHEEIEKCSRNLCDATGLDKYQLGHLFYFEDENFELISIKGNSEPEKQFKGTLSILTAYNYCHGKDRINAADLHKMLENAGVGSLKGLSGTLSKDKYKKFIRKEGKPGSHAFVYKITPLGIQEGLKIIKELTMQDQVSK